MEIVKRLLSKQYIRIIFFILLSYTIFEVSIYILPFELIYYRIHLLFAVLLPSVIIEYFRAENKPYAFGLNFDKLTLSNFFSGLIIAFIAVAIIFLSKLSFINNIIINVNAFNIILELLFDSLIVAFIEEIFFRGIIFQALLDAIKPGMTIFLTSLIFSLFHFFNPGYTLMAFINVFIAGLLFGSMYYITKNLWMPIAFHFGWNFLTSSFIDTPVSGIVSQQPLHYELIAPNNTIVFFINKYNELIYGGVFGIESGLITTLVLLISLILTVKFARLSPFQSALLFNRNYEESKLKSNLM